MISYALTQTERESLVKKGVIRFPKPEDTNTVIRRIASEKRAAYMKQYYAAHKRPDNTNLTHPELGSGLA